ncbi:hypothetical protein [Cetobacterium ceti]
MLKHNFNENDIKILLLLVNTKTITLRELIQEVPISESLIKKNLNKINNTLLSLGFPSLRLKRGIYGILPEHISSIKKLITYSYKYSSEERIFYILFKLITEKKIVLSKESITLNCSRKTLQSNLKECKILLKKFNISTESLHSKYIIAKGKEIDFYNILLILFSKIIIKKESPFYKIYYTKYFPWEKLKLYKNLIKKIEEHLNISLGLRIHNKVISIFVIYENFKNIISNFKFQTKIIPYQLTFIEEELIQDNIFFLEKILEEINSTDYTHSIVYKFIITFESIFYELASKNKTIIYNLLVEAIEDYLFKMSDTSIFSISKITEPLSNFNKTIYNMLLFSQINISQDYFYRLIFYLKNLTKYENNIIYKYNNNLLILDNSLNFSMGTIIKEYLLKNYKLKDIHLLSSLYPFNPSDYDLIFNLNSPIDYSFQMEKNIINIHWEDILNDNTYFSKFNFKEL